MEYFERFDHFDNISLDDCVRVNTTMAVKRDGRGSTFGQCILVGWTFRQCHVVCNGMLVKDMSVTKPCIVVAMPADIHHGILTMDQHANYIRTHQQLRKAILAAEQRAGGCKVDKQDVRGYLAGMLK